MRCENIANGRELTVSARLTECLQLVVDFKICQTLELRFCRTAVGMSMGERLIGRE
jgi:hypothetical protein